MKTWQTGALTGALIIGTGAGALLTPTLHGQSRDREPLVRAFRLAGGDGEIGVSVRDAGSNDKAGGVIVEEVREGSPAEKAGLKAGDAIVEFDGERVRSVEQLQRLVRETPAERQVPAVVVRAGQRVTLSVTPERSRGYYFDRDFPALRMMPAPPAPPAPPAAPEAPLPPEAPRPPRLSPWLPGLNAFTYRASESRLGVTVENLNDELNEYFGVTHGVLVRSVRPESAAAKAGVKAGDVIVSIGEHRIDDPSDVSNELRDHDGGEVTIEVMRDRKSQTLKGTLAARDRRESSRAWTRM
jgi:serine protease Do